MRVLLSLRGVCKPPIQFTILVYLHSTAQDKPRRMQAIELWAGQRVFIDVLLRIEPLGTWNSWSLADRTRWSHCVARLDALVELTGRADHTAPVLANHRPDALYATTGRAKLDRTRWSRNGLDALVNSEQLFNETVTGHHSARVRLESSMLPQRPDAFGRSWPDALCVWSKSWDTRRRWTLTGRVRSNRDRVRSSVRSSLWPPFASVWFVLSHMS
jgi:hypothetical protein